MNNKPLSAHHTPHSDNELHKANIFSSVQERKYSPKAGLNHHHGVPALRGDKGAHGKANLYRNHHESSLCTGFDNQTLRQCR